MFTHAPERQSIVRCPQSMSNRSLLWRIAENIAQVIVDYNWNIALGTCTCPRKKNINALNNTFPVGYGWPSYPQLIIFTGSINNYTTSKIIFTTSINKTLAKGTHN